MSAIGIDGWEHHNASRADGRLRARAGLYSHLTPTAGTQFVSGFSVESPSTTEVWNYLVEQSTTTRSTSIRVVTEDMLALYTYELGILTANPNFTFAVSFGQLMINSPALSAPLYGLVGGGLTTALKQPSINPLSVLLEIPVGCTCRFGDRVAIGAGRFVYFSDPDVDPRTFVEDNVWVVDGQVLDLLVGPDGALYAFTSDAVHVLAADALGKGQQVVGFASVISGVQNARPLNACVSNGAVATLVEDGILFLDGMKKLDLMPYEGRRFYTPAVEVDDMRKDAQLFSIADGFLVGYPNKPFACVVDTRNGLQSFVWTKTGAAMSVRGTLKGRDGEDLWILADRIVQPLGSLDFESSTVRIVACGEILREPDAAGVVRGVTVGADSSGQPTLVFAGGYAAASTTAVRPEDIIVGTSLWSASGNYVGRSLRTTLQRAAVRDGDAHVEVGTDGAMRLMGNVDVAVRGQARRRRDRQR